MLAIQSHRLSWRDSLAFGLWRLFEWIMPNRSAQAQPALQTATSQIGALLHKPAATPARLIVDGVEYVDVGRKFPLRADRLDTYYESADI